MELNKLICTQKKKLVGFTLPKAMMNLKNVNPIKFKSNWSKELKEICTESKFNSD